MTEKEARNKVCQGDNYLIFSILNTKNLAVVGSQVTPMCRRVIFRYQWRGFVVSWSS